MGRMRQFFRRCPKSCSPLAVEGAPSGFWRGGPPTSRALRGRSRQRSLGRPHGLFARPPSLIHGARPLPSGGRRAAPEFEPRPGPPRAGHGPAVRARGLARPGGAELRRRPPRGLSLRLLGGASPGGRRRCPGAAAPCRSTAGAFPAEEAPGTARRAVGRAVVRSVAPSVGGSGG